VLAVSGCGYVFHCASRYGVRTLPIPNIEILPNCYDDTNPLWDLAPPERDTVHIGFAGGSATGRTSGYSRAIEAIIARHPEVRVVEAGGAGLLSQILGVAR